MSMIKIEKCKTREIERDDEFLISERIRKENMGIIR